MTAKSPAAAAVRGGTSPVFSSRCSTVTNDGSCSDGLAARPHPFFRRRWSCKIDYWRKLWRTGRGRIGSFRCQSGNGRVRRRQKRENRVRIGNNAFLSQNVPSISAQFNNLCLMPSPFRLTSSGSICPKSLLLANLQGHAVTHSWLLAYCPSHAPCFSVTSSSPCDYHEPLGA